jgi:hypothetical protein
MKECQTHMVVLANQKTYTQEEALNG